MDWRDRPSPVRKGEEIDKTALTTYLEARFPDFKPPLHVGQFPSGFSNLTYQISWNATHWILRRPPFGAQVRSGHDMDREFRILKGLSPVYRKVPRPVDYCDDESVLGVPFYIMERVDGVILRAGLPFAMQPDPPLMHDIARQFILTLAELHGLDYDAAGLGDLGRPEGYIQRQIAGWTRRYDRAKTDDVPAMLLVAEWLTENQPAEGKAALIHNDFKYDNLVLDPDDWTRVIGVLDWEMATLGDPMMDLGTTLGYWVESGDPPTLQALKLSPTTLPGNPSRTELAEWYGEATGATLEHLVFYYAYGLFKIGVIVQQIYYRYRQGHTQDERFAGLIHAVRACSETAERAIRLNRIDDLYV